MKYLTEKEINFIEALKKDLEAKGDKSFMKVLFQASFEDSETMKEDLNEFFDGTFNELFNSSDLIFEAIGFCYVGKYKDIFWGTGSEGEVFGMGKEIQNVVFPLIFAEIGQVNIPQEKLEVEKYFKKYHDIDYDDYIQSYRDFCASLGFQYKEDLDLIDSQSEDFNRILPSLE